VGELEPIHADGLGSIQTITDDAGNVAHTFEYDAWGNIETGSARGGYAFTGREWDPETGLYYYRARYYDPKAGRFISEDPIGFEAGTNFYAYVGNGPVSRVDPLGDDWLSAGKNFVAGVVTGVAGAAVVAGAAAVSTTAGAVAAVAAVGVGSYELTIAFQEAVLGFDPYTGRALTGEQRADVAAGTVGAAIGGGAFGAASGPKGPLFGRRGPNFGLRDKAGIFNRGERLRWGWSYNKSSGQNEFCWHGGKPRTPSQWHTEGTPYGDFPSGLRSVWEMWP
jgi:RHS repeat-associated protein